MNTPKPQEGTWILTAPNGREWAEHSPLACVAAEQRERVPATVRLQRILDAADELTELEKELLATLKRIRRTPAMPFPDPGAHSWTVYYEAISRAYFDVQRIAAEALAKATGQ
jgi:hypothetical protein